MSNLSGENCQRIAIAISRIIKDLYDEGCSLQDAAQMLIIAFVETMIHIGGDKKAVLDYISRMWDRGVDLGEVQAVAVEAPAGVEVAPAEAVEAPVRLEVEVDEDEVQTAAEGCQDVATAIAEVMRKWDEKGMPVACGISALTVIYVQAIKQTTMVPDQILVRLVTNTLKAYNEAAKASAN